MKSLNIDKSFYKIEKNFERHLKFSRFYNSIIVLISIGLLCLFFISIISAINPQTLSEGVVISKRESIQGTFVIIEGEGKWGETRRTIKLEDPNVSHWIDLGTNFKVK